VDVFSFARTRHLLHQCESESRRTADPGHRGVHFDHILVCNLLVDVAYAFIDPRIRY
jgi:hypothetical protein